MLYAGKMNTCGTELLDWSMYFPIMILQYIDKTPDEDQEAFDQIIEKLRSIKPIQVTRESNL